MRHLALVTLSALLYAAAFPPFGLVAVSWIALAPLGFVLARTPPRTAAAWAALWGGLAAAAVIPWVVPTLREHFGLSVAKSVGLYAFVAVASAAPFYGAALGLHAAARRHAPAAAAPLLFAAAWVTAELARSALGLRSPWLKLGDAHFASERLRQVADVGGVYAVSAVVAAANAAAVELVLAAAAWRRGGVVARAAWIGPTIAASLLVAALLYGEARLGRVPGAARLEAAIVHGSEPQELRWRRATAGRVLRHYGEPTRDLLAARGDRPPGLLVWPENALQSDVDDPVLGRPLRALSRKSPLLLGAPHHERRGNVAVVHNSAFLFRPDGTQARYDKRQLLPFSETRLLGPVGALAPRGELDTAEYAPGDAAGLMALGDERVGVLVCLEALYPGLAREAALGGATLLVNLSNEGWYRGAGAPEQQLAQSVFRAIETRLPLLRATSGGITSIVAPDGRIVARLEDGAGERVLVSLVPAPWPGSTLYTHLGDSFALGCAAVTAFAAAAASGWRGRSLASLRRSPAGGAGPRAQ